MPTGDMVQVHLLTAYPAALLNRDDAGLAKRIPFGGAVRTRVSSQCLKKHWREAPEVSDLGELADRSTRIYEQRIVEPLMRDHGASEAEALSVAQYLMANTVDTKPVKGDDGNDTARSGQLLVLSRAETRFLAEKAVEILTRMREAGASATDKKDLEKAFLLDKPAKKELEKQLKTLASSVDTALFGRMVTSDLFARVDAAVSVAHAFTTHAEAAETDYFTAVDTLKTAEDDAGAGLINDTELTTGVFYSYAVLDMEQLRGNLGAEADRAERLASQLVRAMAMVSPGAKRGSTAPYAYAEFVLLERGPQQPRTLANAFLHPVQANGSSLMSASVQSLIEYRSKMEAMYEPFEGEQVVSTIHRGALDGNGMEPQPLRAALAKIFRAEG
jgi:CRISPR system Cascade subunit CasC